MRNIFSVPSTPLNRITPYDDEQPMSLGVRRGVDTFTAQILELFRLAYTYIPFIFALLLKLHQYHHKYCFLLCVNFQYVVVCVILILGQIAAVVIFYKYPQVVSKKEILFL